MRVLWFTNTPSLGASQLNKNTVGGGWIESLEERLHQISSVELGIAFHIENAIVKPYYSNNTTYFPITVSTPGNKIGKIAFRWSHSIQYENKIEDYLAIVEQFKPDLINIFGTESAFGLISSRTPIPCIIHLQGNLTVYNQKWYSGLTSNDIIKYSGKWDLLKGHGLYHKYFKHKKAAAREREIFHRCRYFIGRTDWDKRISSILSPHSTYFHCEEIMRAGFYSHQWKPKGNPGDTTLITTIRDNIYKGLETIIESINILKNSRPDCPITWKIAGINEKDEIACLIKKKYGINFEEMGIQLLGSLQEKALLAEMLEADLFIHPSHIDNSPNSVCEAMLLGMPVIATFAGGIPTILEDKREGILVQDGDPWSLAGAIIELLENRTHANSLGTNARDKAIIRHNPERTVAQLLHIYSSIK